jgi:hypothetical protein
MKTRGGYEGVATIAVRLLARKAETDRNANKISYWKQTFSKIEGMTIFQNTYLLHDDKYTF